MANDGTRGQDHSDHRDPNPNRPGTVYRARPRWLRFGRSGTLPGRRAPRDDADPGRGSGAGTGTDVPPFRPDAAPAAPHFPPPYQSASPAGPSQARYGSGDSPRYGSSQRGPSQYGVSQYGPSQGGAPQTGGTGRSGPQGTRPLSTRPSRTRPLSTLRRRWPWLVAVLVVLLIGYPVLLGVLSWTSLGKVDALPASGRPADSPGRTYLVVGSDSRQDLTRDERARLGTGQAAGQRTDTIMLLHVPSGDGPTVLVSVPRDSYVPIPGHGKNKINAAYAFGGPQLLVRTIEQATGLHVDEYVETGLGGYANLVDAIGGVQICVKRAMNDPKAHINLQPGCQQLDGKTALGYARARYSDPLGDLGRVQRQREVLAAIAGKTLSPSVLLLPWRAMSAAQAGGGALVVDSGTTPIGLEQFVMAMRAVSGGKGLSLTVPVARSDLQTSAGVAVEWNATQAKILFDALHTDRTEQIRPLANAQKKASG